MTDTAKPWAILQAPFDAESVSLLPRATGDKDQRHKQKCAECGGYHEFPCIHLSYVGHADITMRLNEADPLWSWEPMGYDAHGLPALDSLGGLWAWLTILGSRKPAYGDPGLNYLGKSKAGTADGMKEAIGDMLRNGAMRFGVGTALWSKSDKAKASLYIEDDTDSAPAASAPHAAPQASKTHTNATPAGDDFTMPFGKHKGATLRDLAKTDLTYVAWVADKFGLNDDGTENPDYAERNEKTRQLAARIHAEAMKNPTDPAITDGPPEYDDTDIPF